MTDQKTTKMTLSADAADELASAFMTQCLNEQPPNLLNHYGAHLMAAGWIAAIAVKELSTPETASTNATLCLGMMADMLAELKRSLATDIEDVSTQVH